MNVTLTKDERFRVRKIQLNKKSHLFNNNSFFSVDDLRDDIKSTLRQYGMKNKKSKVCLSDEGYLIDVLVIEDLKVGEIMPFSGCSSFESHRWVETYDKLCQDPLYTEFMFIVYKCLSENKNISELINSDFDGVYGDDLYSYQASIENMVIANFPYNEDRMDEIKKQQIEFFNASFDAMWIYTLFNNQRSLFNNVSHKDFKSKNDEILMKILSKYYTVEDK